MKILNLTTLVLVVIGGLNWGLVGVFNWDLVAAIFGDASLISRLIYTIVGLSAIWQLLPLYRSFGPGEVSAMSGT